MNSSKPAFQLEKLRKRVRFLRSFLIRYVVECRFLKAEIRAHATVRTVKNI